MRGHAVNIADKVPVPNGAQMLHSLPMKGILTIARSASAFASAFLGLAVVFGSAHGAEVTARLTAVTDAPLMLPHDVMLTPDGRHLVVADMGHDRIVLFDAETLAFVSAFGQDEGLSFPHDVAFDDLGRLMVADSGNDRIVFYELDGTAAKAVGTWEGLDGVEGIMQTPDGRFYAALVGANRVVRLDAQGRVEAMADTALGMDLDRPHDVAIAHGHSGAAIIATDPGNHRLIVFDADLRPLYEISTWDPPFTEPKYIATAPDGTLFVADQFANVVRVLSAQSQEIGQIARGEAHLTEGVHVQDGRLWVSDTERGRVLLYQLGEKH